MRIAWFHVPKCGSSLANIVLHLANASLPPSASIADARSCIGTQHHNCLHKDPWSTFFGRYALNRWFRNDTLWHGKTFFDHHQILESDYKAFRGSFVGMFRSPETRFRSAYTSYGRHGLPGLHRIRHPVAPDEYARRMQGTVVKMLAGQSHGLACDVLEFACNATVRPDLPLALRRLHGFAFVGLTEEWTLSICLAHRILGGRCRRNELTNIRPTEYGDDTARVLSNFTYEDAYDSTVYDAVQARFWSDVARYNLTRAQCARECPKAGAAPMVAACDPTLEICHGAEEFDEDEDV